MSKDRTTYRARVYGIFSSALELEAGARAALVDAECREDSSLRAEVETLIALATRDPVLTATFLTGGIIYSEDLAGQVFGRFKLVERIGEGGMGVVYRAERTDGIEQSVAVKLISGTVGMAGQVNFRREAQLLARLEHPAVARLIDAVIDDGRAWIAIEFVRGKRIDSYCMEKQLDCREILGLVAEVADAVAAAHATLVVHSDIKPTNVLVTYQGAPKLIDFGIATVVRDAHLDPSATVNVRQLFSPGYAAPEQVNGGVVTVATDVFGLGALAYRLLTGGAPHAEASSAVSYMVAITQSDVAVASQAALAAGCSASHVRQLRGDVDAILAKALDREPANRYASAAELRADLQRYLGQLPVRARAQSRSYRAIKFVRRNRLAVALSSLLMASILGGGTFAALQARKAAQARDEARTVTAFLTHDILAAANPVVSGTRDVQLRPLLDAASEKLVERFSAQPNVLAELQAAMGAGYSAMFETEKAERLLLAAEQGLSRSLGDSATETEDARMALFDLYVANVDTANLYKVSSRIAAAEKAAGRMDSDSSFRARAMLAWIPCVAKSALIMGLSNCAGAVQPSYEDAYRQLGPDHVVTREIEELIGASMLFAAHEDQAEPVLRDACAGLERHYGPVHSRLTNCRRFLAWALDANGKFLLALPISERVFRDFDSTLGPGSVFTTIAEHDLARTLIHNGQFVRAAEIAQRAIDGLQDRKDADPSVSFRARLLLADALVQSGQRAQGLIEGEHGLASSIQMYGPGNAMSLKLRDMLATTYLHADDPVRAVALQRENLRLGMSLPNRPDWYAGQLELSLAGALMADHLAAEARPLLADASNILTRELGPANQRSVAAHSELALAALP